MLCDAALFLLIKEFKHTLRCRRHRLQHVGNLRKLVDRLRKVAHILDKCLDIPDLYDALCREETAGYRHSHISESAYKHHDRLHHT